MAGGLAAAAYLISSLASVIATAHALRWASPYFWAVGDGRLAGGVSSSGLTPRPWRSGSGSCGSS